MDKIYIPDFIDIDGGRPLAEGAAVHISGAKNEVLGAMSAAVLTDKPVVFNNVPFVTDVLDMCEILRGIGVSVDYDPARRRVAIHAKKIASNILPPAALNLRASYYIWGALLARFVKTGEWKSLKLQKPGGCGFTDISGDHRKFDYHENLIRNVLGATLVEAADNYEFVLPPKFVPAARPIFHTPLISHGATFHWMLTAALLPNLEFMYNAAMESEVPHLLGILHRMGAKLRGSNTTAIVNFGFGGKLLDGGEFDIMPDRMETGFYALLAMALKSRIKLIGTDAESCRPWLNSVIEIAGAERCQIYGDFMRFDFTDMPDFDGRDFVMSPIPGKETDMHQVWTPILATARTRSRIYDPIWIGRTGHLPELAKFGIRSESRVVEAHDAGTGETSKLLKSSEITIFPSKLHAAEANGMDLRGTPGLIIAAAMCAGRSRIHNPKFALRGYPNLVENLLRIGINVAQ